MTENKAITYSLLAHIRNSGTLMKGPIDPFIPLIKRSLYKLNAKGILSGKSIKEIHDIATDLYTIDFPLPVLKTILQQIAKEVNTDGQQNFMLYQDGAFAMKNFFFEDFEEKILASRREVDTLEGFYVDFLKLHNVEDKDKTTIFDFIEKNKISISKYLANHQHTNGKDYTIEAKFVQYFRNIPDVFDIIRNIYLGSIISSYLEYKTESTGVHVELVFDTNFLISLVDLNTPESTHTCNKLIEVCRNLGYKFTVLHDTIDETKSLIVKKAEYFSKSLLSKRVNPEDIYNACERRQLNKNDLERIADNLEETLSKIGITILPNTDKYKNKAKFSPEYEAYKKYRSSHYAALHDATAIYYVRDKRNDKRVKEFEKVSCWFVNNSITHDIEDEKNTYNFNNDFQPDIIRADELLNIIWLANPNLSSSINTKELVDISLSSIVALTLNSTLPKASIIKELDENIQKYRGDIITDKDILLISSRISHRQLKDISELNALAETDDSEFTKRIKAEAKKQEEEENIRIQKFDDLFKKFENQINDLDRVKRDLKVKKDLYDSELESSIESTKEKDNLISSLKDEIKIQASKSAEQDAAMAKMQAKLDAADEREEKAAQRKKEEARKTYIEKEIRKWRRKTNIELGIWFVGFVILAVWLFWVSNWSINDAAAKFKEMQSHIIIGSLITFLSLVFCAITIRKWYDRNCNPSTLENFKKGIEIPEELT